MKTQHILATISGSVLYLAACSPQTYESQSPLESQVATTQSAHNITEWWDKKLVASDVQIVFGGNVIFEGRFTIEAHGPKARYDKADGTAVIFDGETAYAVPGNAEAEGGRFHGLTWPWFIMAPFKMTGEGTNLSDLETRKMGGMDYTTIFQTFDSGNGDTPDDWYRFYISRETQLIDAMSYIVTYGKDLDEAEKSVSIIVYSNYTEEGPRIAKDMAFYYINEETGELSEEPKGTGTVRNIEYLPSDNDVFVIPEGARELPLPEINAG